MEKSNIEIHKSTVYRYRTKPPANSQNIIVGEHYRITMLTSRLIRLEYKENDCFVDEASQIVWNRDFPECEYRVKETEDLLLITTKHLRLSYNKQSFQANGLSIQVLGNVSIYNSLWHYGETGRNLGGTARTLDEVDGSCPLEEGVLSRDGFAILEDSKSLLLTEDDWVSPRERNGQDIYFFGYGHDYKACLKDFYYLCGKTPLLPRYALGNWWSRYYRYTEEEYRKLILRFEREKIPFSVAVMDMDWHLVGIPEQCGSDWTGFTWNRDLFPDPEAFMAWLHEKNLRVTLNIHPADGIRAHEEMYLEMAEALGVDAERKDPIVMDVTNWAFMKAYFTYAHHPNEKSGVDFWWVDWQQGTHSRIEGLDPLWMLNHYYFLDSGRDGKRPMTLSRYAGPGSHRYPIGFSGDSTISWKSLEFQPYFTTNASNIGYGWWSHDIGGHMMGIKDDEMAGRWLQFGVFSPIMRLHSSNSEFNGKEPWRYRQEVCEMMKYFLRLRHRMIPYLYTMNYRNHAEDLPLIEPMYYEYPEEREAYQVPNQYYFGSECIVAPITEKAEETTGLGKVKVWLPKGRYYDYFTGLIYQGDRMLTCYRDVSSLPVFLKEGAILPMMAADQPVEQNPETLLVAVFPGKDEQFTLYEDDNTTIAYEQQECVQTQFLLKEEKDKTVFRIGQTVGLRQLIPQKRNYQLLFLGCLKQKPFVYLNGKYVDETEDEICSTEMTEQGMVMTLQQIPTDCNVEICFHDKLKQQALDEQKRCFDLLNLAQIPFHLKDQLYEIICRDQPVAIKMIRLVNENVPEVLLGALGEILTASEKETFL